MPALEFQPLFWLTGDANTGQVVQPDLHWIDTQGYSRLVVTTEMFALTTGVSSSLVIQTSDTPGGDWADRRTFDSQDVGQADVLTLSSEVSFGDSGRMRRYVRWSFNAGSGTAHVCFRMRALLK